MIYVVKFDNGAYVSSLTNACYTFNLQYARLFGSLLDAKHFIKRSDCVAYLTATFDLGGFRVIPVKIFEVCEV